MTDNKFLTKSSIDLQLKCSEARRNGQPKKQSKPQTTYLAFTVPIRLSSEERANAGSSTVTSNFGKTEQKCRDFYTFLKNVKPV